jgi:tRNA U34 5-methylaminomethyl-2-thiouridine-forming methyltransferase MnmC
MEKMVVQNTADGSPTVYSPVFDATYHSSHGALQESRHVFIESGLQQAHSVFPEPIVLLEFGFGTGLNALLTALWNYPSNALIEYTAMEAYPVEAELALQLPYPELVQIDSAREIFDNMHLAPWNTKTGISPFFTLTKVKDDFNSFPKENLYNLVYLDAFAPGVQPQFWENPFLESVFNHMAPQGILITYCAKGSFKRALKQAGFEVEALPGPPGKREITRARKPVR